MSKVIQIRDADLIRALEDGTEIVADQHRFLLVELHNEEPEDVTDPQDVNQLERALQNTRPLLSSDEARAYIQARLREHGNR